MDERRGLDSKTLYPEATRKPGPSLGNKGFFSLGLQEFGVLLDQVPGLPHVGGFGVGLADA